MSNELFVRDFAPDMNAGDLEILFSQVGDVQKTTLTHREHKGVSRRVAYIEMSSPEEARDCIARFHGLKAGGYTLTVTENKVHVPDPYSSFKRQVPAAAAAPRPRRARRPFPS